MADLLSTPPLPKLDGAIPRDWRSVTAGELVEGQVLRFVELDTPVESACQVSHLCLILLFARARGISIEDISLPVPRNKLDFSIPS